MFAAKELYAELVAMSYSKRKGKLSLRKSLATRRGPTTNFQIVAIKSKNCMPYFI